VEKKRVPERSEIKAKMRHFRTDLTAAIGNYSDPASPWKVTKTYSNKRYSLLSLSKKDYFVPKIIHGLIIPVTIPPPGIPPGIGNFFLTW